jgi:hypothetical protein
MLFWNMLKLYTRRSRLYWKSVYHGHRSRSSTRSTRVRSDYAPASSSGWQSSRATPETGRTRARRGSPAAPTAGGVRQRRSWPAELARGGARQRHSWPAAGRAHLPAQWLASACSREEEGKMMLHCVVCWRWVFMGHIHFYCRQPKLVNGSLIWVSIVGVSLTQDMHVPINTTCEGFWVQPDSPEDTYMQVIFRVTHWMCLLGVVA